MDAPDKMRAKLKNIKKRNLNAIGKKREAQADVKQEQEQQPTQQWMRWCRLCAKEDERNNFNVFLRNDQNTPDKMLATAIGKYFWVNVKSDDEISQFICSECHTLLDALVNFTERVNKVQTMFNILKNSSDPIDPNELRLQYGLLDEERQHIIQPREEEIEEEYEEQDTKPTMFFEVQEENDDEQEIDDCDEEYKEALKEFEQHENTDAASPLSNDVELFSEDEMTHKRVKMSYLKKFFKKECIDLDEKIANNTEDVEIDGNEEFIYEYTVDDHGDGDDDNFDEVHVEDVNSIVITPKLGNETQNISSNKIAEPCAWVRPKRKVGRPRNHTAEKDDDSALEKRIKVNESTDGGGGENSAESAKFCCKLCPKKYKSVVVYRRHMQEIHDVFVEATVEYHCSQCDKVCQSERQLAAHIQSHLPLELKQTFPCPYCDKKFTKEVIVDQHIHGVHLNEKPFICEECGRALKTNAALKEHKFTHTNDCPFECEWCHKRFKNKPRLKIHMDTHNNTAYKCDECGLQLNTRRTLNMHMLVHSTDKPFKCDHCGTEFKRAKALKNHLIIHTGLKPYICEFCNKAFANGSNCRSHKKKAHPVELAAAEAQGITPRQSNVPKLDHLREVTKHSKNLLPVNKQVALPSNWREVLLKAEARSKRSSQKKLQQADSDVQFDQDYDSQHEPEEDTHHEDESAAIIIEKMVSDDKVVEEIHVQLNTMDS